MTTWDAEDFGSPNEKYWKQYAAEKSGGASISAPPPRSAWETFMDSLHNAMTSAGSGLNAAFVRGNEAAREEDLARQWGSDHNQKPSDVDKIIKENQLLKAAEIQEKRASSQMRSDDDSSRRSRAGNVASKAADIAGSVVGDANPTYAIGGFGANALERIIGMGAVTGANDMIGQGDEVRRDIREHGDPLQTVGSVVGGAALQGTGEVGAKVVNAIGGRMKIAAGARMDNFGELMRTMLNLEGGGTIASPKISKKGAKGPAQVMDATARDPGYGVKPWDGKTESDRFRVGAQYLAVMNHEFGGDEAKVLAAYNAGPNKVKSLIQKYGENWADHLPNETKVYVEKGLQGMIDRHQPVGPQGPDGLPTNGSVPPIPSEDLAKIMNDPAAAGVSEPPHAAMEELDAQMERGDISFTEYQKQLDAIGATNLNPPSAEIHDIADLRKAKDFKDASDQIDKLYDRVSNFNDAVVQSGRTIDVDSAENTRSLVAKEIGKYEPDTPEYNKLLEVDDMLKEAIAHSGGKPRIYAEDAETPFMGEPEVKDPANVNEPLERDTNPPASSSSFGTEEPRGANPPRDPNLPTKGPDGHDEDTPPLPILKNEKRLLLDKLGDALEQGAPIRREAEAAIAKERARRIASVYSVRKKSGGEEGFYKELAALKGEMGRPKIESIRGWFTPKEIDQLYDGISHSAALQGYESVVAKKALNKLLGEDYGEIPTPREIELLSKAMPSKAKVWRALLENEDGAMPYIEGNVKSTMVNIAGLPRTLKASFDFSAPFRQGMFLVGRKEFWKAMPDMFKSFFNEGHFEKLQEEIFNRPTYPLMNRAGLQTTRNNGGILDREEAFISQFAESIPGVRHSERAYLAFLNKLRADVFDDFVKKGEKLGIDFVQDPHYLKSAARFINAATGRGDINLISRNAQLLGNVLFSPRLMASRLQLLYPGFYVGLHPKVRAEAGKSGLIYASTVMSILGMAGAAGADIEMDPRSSDFAKIKVGNTRFDVTGGFQPYVRFYAQFLTGQQKGINDKIIRNIGWSPTHKLWKGEDQGAFKPTTRKDVVYRFFENKEAPNASEITRLLQGTDPVGNKLTPTSEAVNLFAPLIVADTYQAYKDLGPTGLLTAAPNAFGVGVQTYTPKEKKGGQKWSSDDFGDSSWSKKDFE